MSLIDTFLDYLTARLRLESHGIETAGRALLARVMIVLVGGGLALFGMIFLALGCAGAIGNALGSKPAGIAIVGMLCAAAGMATVLLAARQRRPGRD